MTYQNLCQVSGQLLDNRRASSVRRALDPKHSIDILKTMIPNTYAQQGASALLKRQNLVTSLLSERRLPKQRCNEGTIKALLQAISQLYNCAWRQCIANASIALLDRELLKGCPLCNLCFLACLHSAVWVQDLAPCLSEKI